MKRLKIILYYFLLCSLPVFSNANQFNEDNDTQQLISENSSDFQEGIFGPEADSFSTSEEIVQSGMADSPVRHNRWEIILGHNYIDPGYIEREDTAGRTDFWAQLIQNQPYMTFSYEAYFSGSFFDELSPVLKLYLNSAGFNLGGKTRCIGNFLFGEIEIEGDKQFKGDSADNIGARLRLAVDKVSPSGVVNIIIPFEATLRRYKVNSASQFGMQFNNIPFVSLSKQSHSSYSFKPNAVINSKNFSYNLDVRYNLEFFNYTSVPVIDILSGDSEMSSGDSAVIPKDTMDFFIHGPALSAALRTSRCTLWLDILAFMQRYINGTDPHDFLLADFSTRTLFSPRKNFTLGINTWGTLMDFYHDSRVLYKDSVDYDRAFYHITGRLLSCEPLFRLNFSEFWGIQLSSKLSREIYPVVYDFDGRLFYSPAYYMDSHYYIQPRYKILFSTNKFKTSIWISHMWKRYDIVPELEYTQQDMNEFVYGTEIDWQMGEYISFYFDIYGEFTHSMASKTLSGKRKHTLPKGYTFSLTARF